MGVRNQASYNPTLTNYAQGVAQDVSRPLAEFLAPTVDTGGATSGGYKKYDEKNAFQAIDYARAVGGGFKRIEFSINDGTFNCKPVGLEIALDDDEAPEGVDRSRVEQAKIKTLVTTLHVSREYKVITAINAAVSALPNYGVYSNTAVDPINEIDSVIEAMAITLGQLPNRLALGISAWRIIKNLPKVLSRQPGSTNQGVTLAQFTGMLLNPGIDARIGMISRDTTKFGATKAEVNIVGARIFLFYAEQNATQYDAGAVKTFTTHMGNVDSVETYREEGVTSDIHRVRWSEDIEVCTSAAIKRIDLS